MKRVNKNSKIVKYIIENIYNEFESWKNDKSFQNSDKEIDVLTLAELDYDNHNLDINYHTPIYEFDTLINAIKKNDNKGIISDIKIQRYLSNYKTCLRVKFI